ncbi:MAG: nuclear transport factor 2 family protein [Sulfurifustis sp.]
MKNQAADIVHAYLDAIAARDFQRARSFLSDHDFSTRSPISTFDSADAYVADISRIGPILENIERRKIFVDGEDVCAILDYVTRMDQRQVSPVAHWFHLARGKITSIESFFDARGYAEMFDVE